MVALLLALERLVPYERLWGMTWRHLWRRDLPFIAMNGAALALIDVGLTALSIEAAVTAGGRIAAWPLGLQLVVGLLASDSLCQRGGGTGPRSCCGWGPFEAEVVRLDDCVVRHHAGALEDVLSSRTLPGQGWQAAAAELRRSTGPHARRGGPGTARRCRGRPARGPRARSRGVGCSEP
ncbi:MAG: hypothetical protein JNL82_16020 [Myxococcales bacterium]|nr:hypothetical protein [Myxococcales bacterium]